MSRIIVMLLLAVVSSNAMAEWVKVGGTDDMTCYVDPATIHKAGDTVEMWYLFDSKMGISTKTHGEFDCKGKRLRDVYLASYSGNMSAGTEVVVINRPDQWDTVKPRTLIETLWKYACGEK